MPSYNACHREAANAAVAISRLFPSYLFLEIATGSDATAASGGLRELSEWQRSADDAAALSARKMPGTATGNRVLAMTTEDEPHR